MQSGGEWGNPLALTIDWLDGLLSKLQDTHTHTPMHTHLHVHSEITFIRRPIFILNCEVCLPLCCPFISII